MITYQWVFYIIYFTLNVAIISMSIFLIVSEIDLGNIFRSMDEWCQKVEVSNLNILLISMWCFVIGIFTKNIGNFLCQFFGC